MKVLFSNLCGGNPEFSHKLQMVKNKVEFVIHVLKGTMCC